MRFCLTLILLCVGLNQGGFACECLGTSRPCERLSSAAVFVGRVIETVATKHQEDDKTWYPGYSMRFAVDESFRGELGTKVMIETGWGGGDCGTPLEPGGKFLIFAYKAKDNQLWTGMCSGNRRLTGSADEVELLQELRDLVKQGSSTIFGSVFQSKPVWRDDEIANESAPKPVSGMVLVAKSDGYSTSTKTKADGTFEFTGLPKGKYAVGPEKLQGWDFDHEYEENYQAELSDGACAHINFRLNPTTRIRGHLTIPAEVKDRTIEVVAIPVDMKELNQFTGKYDFTDEDGRFNLWPLPPGDYFVGVNINSSPKEDSPFPPTYYPGVTSQKAASVIHLEEGETQDLELPLSELAKPRTVRFVAIGLDGKPMKHIYIQREDLRHPGDAASYVNVDLDRNGAGKMIVYAGYFYHLHGSQFISDGNEWCAKPVTISAGSKPVSVRFVMDHKSDNCNIHEIDNAANKGRNLQ